MRNGYPEYSNQHKQGIFQMSGRSFMFFLSLVLLLGYPDFSMAQESGIVVTGRWENVPFNLFVDDIEQQAPVKFLYHPEITDSLFISITFKDEPLIRGLRRVFNGTNVSFFINSDNKIILTDAFQVQAFLPIGFFDQTSTDAPIADELVDFMQEEEKQVKLQITIENTLFEIGKKTAIRSGEYGNLAGVIKDNKTGEPLIGVLVYIDKPRIGVATDQYGYYSLSIPKGRHELLLRNIGYKDTKRQIILYADGKLNIEMMEDVIPLKEVIIESEKDVNVAGMQMGVDKLDAAAMKKVPPILGEVDILRIALTLPGVQSVGEGANGINVRGGAADQNLMLLNDAPIYNPSHFFGFFSSFNPDIIKSVELYKGGIEAHYGGRISSIFDVQAKEGNNREFVCSGGISPVTARLTFEGPIMKDKLSYIISGRSTYSDWLLQQMPNPSIKNSSASFYDIYGKLSYDINEKNSLYVAGYYSDDSFKLNSDTTYSYSNENASVQWKHIFNNKLYGVFSGIYSGYGYDIYSDASEANAFDMNYSIQNLGGKIDFSYFPNSRHKIDFGINSLLYRLDPGTLLPRGDNSLVNPVFLEKEQGLESAIYIGDKFEVSRRISIYAGLRYSYYQYLGPKTVNEYAPDSPLEESTIIGEVTYDKGEVIKTYGGPEIRLSAKYAINQTNSLKISYNRMRQYINMLSNTTSISPTDIWKLSDPYVKPQIGDQISLGYYRNFANNTIEGSVEGYYKTIENLLDFKSGARLILNEEIETDIINGYGKSYGVEFLLRKNTGKLNGWVSYTFSRALIKSESEYITENINDGEYYPASWDKPNSLSVVANWKFSRRLSISTNFAYSTGRPITYPVAKYYFNGTERLHYSDRNQYRIPDYLRLDLSINIEGNHKVHKLNHSSWTIAVYNLTGRDNAYSIFFVSEQGKVQGYQLSIFAEAIPTITYNFRF